MPDKEEERRHIIRATGGESEHSVQFEKKDPNDHRVSLALAELYELGLIEHWHIVTYLDNADRVMHSAFLAVYVFAKELKSKADQREGWERLAYFTKAVAEAYVSKHHKAGSQDIRINEQRAREASAFGISEQLLETLTESFEDTNEDEVNENE